MLFCPSTWEGTVTAQHHIMISEFQMSCTWDIPHFVQVPFCTLLLSLTLGVKEKTQTLLSASSTTGVGICAQIDGYSTR